MGIIAQSLLRHAAGYQSSQYGVALEDFSSMPATSELGAEIVQGLHSDDPLDRRIGLLFCEGFLKCDRISHLGNSLAEHLPAEVVRLAGDSDDLARSAAHVLLVGVRASVSNYRAIMLKALVDTDAQVRTVALNATETFLRTGEVDPLLTFERDSYLAEIAPGGPIHYVLRNQALATIERMLGRQFTKHELTEMLEGEAVFWWDWRPMLEWHQASKNSLWAKLRDKLGSG